VGPNGQQIQLQQVTPSGVTLQPQIIKTIQPIQQSIAQQPQPVPPQVQATQKQVSKVRAMKVQPKPNSPLPQGQVRPNQARPNSRPLMVVVQPKPQNVKPEDNKDSHNNAAAAAACSSNSANPVGAQPSLVPATEIKVEEMDTLDTPETAAAGAVSTDAPAEPAPPTVPEKQTGLVKPNVLTHVIEGFVIQEASEPFPVRHHKILTLLGTTIGILQVERSHVLHDLMSLHNGSDASDSENGDKITDGLVLLISLVAIPQLFYSR
jgi:hypothetical protein